MFWRPLKYILIPLAVSAIVALGMYYALSAIGEKEAKEHVQDILLSNRGLHEYIQGVMHPLLFDAIEKGEVSKDFYRPELFSSTYIVRTQHEFYNAIREKDGMHPVYYKLAAMNPRNPVNLADERELRLIEKFNADHTIIESEEIVSMDGVRYIYYAVPFMQNDERCMRCHGDPADAPPGLRALYPGEGGFHEKPGEIRAIESIRMPITNYVNRAMVLAGGASSGVFALFMLSLLSLGLRRRIIDKTLHLEQEIATRKQAEESYREVVEGTNDLITKVDSEGRLIFANQQAERILGVSPSEAIGLSAFEFIHPDDRKKTMDAFTACVNDHKPIINLENRQVNRKTGETFNVLWTSNIHYDSGGNVTRVTSMARDITEHLQTELRYKQLFDKMLSGYAYYEMIYDKNGVPLDYRFVDVNPAFERLTGLDAEKVIGRTVFEVMPDTERYWIETYAKVADNGMPIEFENYSGALDKHFEVVAFSPQKGRFVTVFQDISPRRQALKSLEESEAKFSAIFHNSNDGLLVADMQTRRFVLANNTICDMLGYSQSELIGLSVKDIHPADSLDRIREEFGMQARGDLSVSEDVPVMRKNGSVFHADLSAFPVSIAGAQCMVGVFRDITERKVAEEEIHKRSRLINTLIDNSPLAIIGMDLKGCITLWNKAAETLFGWSADEAIGMPNPVVPQDRRHEMELLVQELRIRGNYHSRELIRQRKDGSLFIANVASSCLYDFAGAIVGYMAIFEDITEKKAAMETISKSLREKEVLLQEVHHRVKNNMAVISSLLKMQSTFVHDDRTLAALTESQSRIRSMALVHEKLYQSKDFTNIDVREYVLSLARSIRDTYNTGACVELLLQVDDISLNIDTLVPCGLIINELLSNAYKYAFNGKCNDAWIALSLKQEHDGNRLLLMVSDNGIGLPTSFNIEEPTGLGLKLVTALTSQLEGSLEARSEGGAHFTVSFNV